MANKLTVLIKPIETDEQVIGQNLEINRQDRSGFYSELLSAGLSCGAATLSWVVVTGGSVAAPVTFGSSTVIIVLGVGAAGASGLQCINSAMRLFNESMGNSEENSRLDSLEWYSSTSTALDILSIAGGIAAAGVTIKMAFSLRKTTGKGFKEILKQLNRHERKRITEEVIRAQNPHISNKTLKLMVNAGQYPKRYSHFEINNSVRLQLKDALGAAFSFTGSATSGVIRSPSKIPEMGIAIMEEFESW